MSTHPIRMEPARCARARANPIDRARCGAISRRSSRGLSPRGSPPSRALRRSAGRAWHGSGQAESHRCHLAERQHVNPACKDAQCDRAQRAATASMARDGSTCAEAPVIQERIVAASMPPRVMIMVRQAPDSAPSAMPPRSRRPPFHKAWSAWPSCRSLWTACACRASSTGRRRALRRHRISRWPIGGPRRHRRCGPSSSIIVLWDRCRGRVWQLPFRAAKASIAGRYDLCASTDVRRCSRTRDISRLSLRTASGGRSTASRMREGTHCAVTDRLAPRPV